MEKSRGCELINKAQEMFKGLSDEEFIEMYKETMRLFYIEKTRRFDDLELGVEMPDVVSLSREMVK